MPDEYGNPTQEELDQLLAGMDPNALNMMLATNQFGVPANEDYDPQDRINFFQDLGRTGGFYLQDLLGFGPDPEDPGAAPVAPVAPTVYQSDIPAAYSSNPVLAEGFQLIDQGVDPFEVIAAVKEKFGEDGVVLPEYQSDFGGSRLDQDAVSDIFTKYTEDRARSQRERAQASPEYDQKQQIYETELADWEAQKKDFDAFYNPMSEFELRGAPSQDQEMDLINQYIQKVAVPRSAAQYAPTNAPIRMAPTSGPMPPNFQPDPRLMLGNNARVPDVPETYKGKPVIPFTGPGPRGYTVSPEGKPMIPSDKFRGPVQGPGVSRNRPNLVEAAPTGGRTRADFVPTKETQAYLQDFIQRSQEKQKQNVRPSGQQQKMRAITEALYRLSSGENFG